MSVVNNTLLLAAEEGGYRIERSLRLRSSASAYLNRTFTTPTSTTTWSLSWWVKRGILTTNAQVFSDGGDFIYFGAGNLVVKAVSGAILETSQLFRDPSAWYHILVVADTTNATANDRVKLYVNGSQVTAFASRTNPSQNAATLFNANSSTNRIGGTGTVEFFDGYLTEINFIDGQALTPSDFGEFNEDTGVWQPIEYAGTYGTNGFYLNFKDNASTSALGDDLSGNGNDWTTNNISLTAGATYDSMIDTPTPYADGGNGRGNYCTLNPINPPNGVTISGGNLNFACSDDTTPREAFCTIGVKTGKWYFEATKTNTCDRFYAGIIESIYKPGQGISFGKLRFDTSSSSNITIMFAVDFDAGLYWGGVSGTFTGDPSAGTGGTSFTVGSNAWVPLVGGYREEQPSAVGNANFGQRPFAYTPPTGFKALNTQNLPESTVVDGGEYFNTVLYTGTGSTQTISGVGFQPDFTWIKSRSNSTSHEVHDVIRGVGRLFTDSTSQELTSLNGWVDFASDGFVVDGVGGGGEVNVSGRTYVAWNWKAHGAGVTNTAGSITSTVSANTTAGFSVVTYTGTGAAATVGHGLGVAPSMMIVKWRTGGSTQSWAVYHASLGATKYLALNTTAAEASATSVWNDTAPTSSVLSVLNDNWTNASTWTYVAYCFAPVAGYSAFGSYTGNGSADGPFVFTGFRPAFVLVKQSSASGEPWNIYDDQRLGFNPASKGLYANSSDAENDASGRYKDLLSNGFKIRGTSGEQNASGATYIYMAFAENPFSVALAR
jgi:hypothetical protein